MLDFFAHHTPHHDTVQSTGFQIFDSNAVLAAVTLAVITITVVALVRTNAIKNIKTLIKGRNK